jgi:spore maturation protein SpmA
VFPERGYDTRKRSSARSEAFTSGGRPKNAGSGGRRSSLFVIANLEAKNPPPYNCAVLNYIWLGLVLASMVLGAVQLGQHPDSAVIKDITDAAFAACKTAVELVITLIGLMALWLGVMRLAEKSGLVGILARAMRPIMQRLFPDVPPEHPAMGSMLMNVAANMLGLGNAATPLGLRAMQQLEKLNPRPGTATNAMCTFLAINTSSVQLVPATTVAYLAAAGAKDPTWIIGPAFIATLCSTIAGVTAVKLLARLPGYRLPPAPVVASPPETADSDADTLTNQTPLPTWSYPILVAYFALFAWLLWRLASLPSADNPVIAVVRAISLLAVPFLLSFFPLFAALKRIPVYEEFVEGAKEGFHVAIRIIPYLVAILVAIGMFRAAGGIELIAKTCGPALKAIGFPVELLPLVLMRPLSGGGASGIFNELIRQVGPDSMIAHMAGCIMGSTETTFYVIAVYFGSVAVRRTRHAVPAGLIADFTGVVASIIICRLVFA